MTSNPKDKHVCIYSLLVLSLAWVFFSLVASLFVHVIIDLRFMDINWRMHNWAPVLEIDRYIFGFNSQYINSQCKHMQGVHKTSKTSSL